MIIDDGWNLTNFFSLPGTIASSFFFSPSFPWNAQTFGH
jgi:hypothetical protein